MPNRLTTTGAEGWLTDFTQLTLSEVGSKLLICKNWACDSLNKRTVLCPPIVRYLSPWQESILKHRQDYPIRVVTTFVS